MTSVFICTAFQVILQHLSVCQSLLPVAWILPLPWLLHTLDSFKIMLIGVQSCHDTKTKHWFHPTPEYWLTCRLFQRSELTLLSSSVQLIHRTPFHFHSSCSKPLQFFYTPPWDSAFPPFCTPCQNSTQHSPSSTHCKTQARDLIHYSLTLWDTRCLQ